jgi:hypothetical protein
LLTTLSGKLESHTTDLVADAAASGVERLDEVVRLVEVV